MKANIRFTGLWLSLLMLLSLAVGACGGSSNSQGQTLHVLIGYNSTYSTKQQLTMSGASPDQLIAVPWVMRPFAMVYNKELFQKAGITTPPTTWTQFVQDAQKMTDSSAGVYGAEIDPSDSFDPWKIWWMFAGQQGGNFISQDLKTAQMNTPEAVQAVKFWFDWATTYKIVDPNSMTWKAGDTLKAFANGKVG